MKLRFFLSALVAGGLMTSQVAVAAPDTVVAVVDGKKITFEEVMKQKDALGKELQGIPEDKLFPLLQNKLVNDIIIEKAAKESDIGEKPEVKEALAVLTQQFIIQAFLADKIKGSVSDADVKSKYQELVQNFPDEKEARIRHILVKDEAKAKQIIKALKNKSASFKDLVKKSEDKATAQRGGEIGFMAKSMLPKDVGEKVFALKAGGFTPDPVQTELGWHVFLVDEYRDAKPPAYEEAKDELKALMAEEALIKFMQDLREKSSVELLDENGKPLPEKKAADAEKKDESASS